MIGGNKKVKKIVGVLFLLGGLYILLYSLGILNGKALDFNNFIYAIMFFAFGIFIIVYNPKTK